MKLNLSLGALVGVVDVVLQSKTLVFGLTSASAVGILSVTAYQAVQGFSGDVSADPDYSPFQSRRRLVDGLSVGAEREAPAL